MKLISSLILGSVFLTGYAFAQDYGAKMESIRFESFDSDEEDEEGDNESGREFRGGQRGFQGGSGGYGWGDLDKKICQAVQERSPIQVIFKSKEATSSKELKISTQILTIEPYAFGMTRDGKPVLKGNVVEHKDFKVVTVKMAEEKFKDMVGKNKPEKGWFNSDTGVRLIDLRRVKNIRIISDKHFEGPKDFKGFQDDKNLDIIPICGLPVKIQEKEKEKDQSNKKGG